MRAKKKGRKNTPHILSLQGAYGPLSGAGGGSARRGTNAEAEIWRLAWHAADFLGQRAERKHGARLHRLWAPSFSGCLLGKHLHVGNTIIDNSISSVMLKGALRACAQPHTSATPISIHTSTVLQAEGRGSVDIKATTKLKNYYHRCQVNVPWAELIDSQRRFLTWKPVSYLRQNPCGESQYKTKIFYLKCLSFNLTPFLFYFLWKGSHGEALAGLEL